MGKTPVSPTASSGDQAAERGQRDSVSGRDRANRAPDPPWGKLPLTEVAVLLGLVAAAAGFFIGGSAGTSTMITGLLLASLAGFEQALREHRSGYRSHAFVLAGIPAAVAIGVMALLDVPKEVFPPVAVAVLIGAWLPIRSAYRRSDSNS